jgi:aminoglycoside phosphotransferase (APT) family kinase protein
MDRLAKRVAEKCLGRTPTAVAALGGGFYGRVFRVDLDRAPHRVIVKLYLFPGLHRPEAVQLTTLAAHALLRVPKVHALHDADPDVPHDALVMEWIDGINAGDVGSLPARDRARIAAQIVENLIAWHRIVHVEGFGALGGATFAADGREAYRAEAEAHHRLAARMHAGGRIDDTVKRVVDRAWANFDAIFSAPLTSARLVHGDYNTWNVMLDHQAANAIAVIDPFNARWTDSEFDLYQLDNANGPAYGLLDTYAARFGLSENYPLKRAFHELFTEIMHFETAGIDPARSAIPAQARRLDDAMGRRGIR